MVARASIGTRMRMGSEGGSSAISGNDDSVVSTEPVDIQGNGMAEKRRGGGEGGALRTHRTRGSGPGCCRSCRRVLRRGR